MRSNFCVTEVGWRWRLDELSLFAGLGSNIVSLFHGAATEAIMLLGMDSYFAGVMQSPITAFVIVTEMTDHHAMVARRCMHR